MPSFFGGDGDDGHTQVFGQLPHMDGVAAGPHLVHHVEGDDHGDAQLHQLKGQVKISLNIGGVYDVDDGSGILLKDEVSGDDLFGRVGGEGVDAGQIHQDGIPVVLDGTFLLFHCHAGEVAHMLVAAGEAVEEGGFAAVLVARQGEKIFHCCSLLRLW